MNQDDNNYQKTSPGPKKETQQSFEEDSYDDNPRRLEPVFEDIEPLVASEDSSDRPLQRAGYDAQYDDDTIDYDIEHEALSERDLAGLDRETETDSGAPWQGADLKPELPHYTEPDSGHEDSQEWQDDEPYYDDEDGGRADAPWPLSLIVIAGFAVLLVAAGGYGVMQQRTEMKEEIRTLQASIATSASPEEVVASRAAQVTLSEENAQLSATIDSLQMEIRTLKDTAAGLESQLNALQSDPASKARGIATTDNTPKPDLPSTQVSVKPAVEPATAAAVVSGPTGAVAATRGDWFVNFGSYRKKDTATAWANRLDSSAGQVAVVTGINNGETFYRVRVVDLTTRQQAEGIARTLEREHDLSKLWVGRQ